jgi:hypothetical protein
MGQECPNRGSLGVDTIAAPLMQRLAVESNDVVRAAVIGAMTSRSEPSAMPSFPAKSADRCSP